MLAEYLSGGLTARRLRQLAARVVAVHDMLDGAEFPEVLGTIAGDDTVLVIGREPAGGDALAHRFLALAENHAQTHAQNHS